jgi:uncharacterized coiled-coil DUF342 family protein
LSDDPIAAILAALADIRAQMATREDLAKLRAEFLAELGTRTAAITEKVAELKAEVTAIRDDIAVNMGAVDQIERVNETTRADVRQLREQVSVMWKQLKQAQQDIRELKGTP